MTVSVLQELVALPSFKVHAVARPFSTGWRGQCNSRAAGHSLGLGSCLDSSPAISRGATAQSSSDLVKLGVSDSNQNRCAKSKGQAKVDFVKAAYALCVMLGS